MSDFKIRSESVPNTDESFPNADAWKVTVTNPRGLWLTHMFYKGYGHKGAEPTLEEFLGSLISDAESVEDRDLEEFAEEFGGEIRTIKDAKRIEKTYEECKKTAERLGIFLTIEELERFRD